MTAPTFPPASPRSGMALVIALGLIVLVAVSVVTFLSTVTLRRQVSSQSAAQAAVDTLAKGALSVTLADLLQEMADGSTTTNVSGGGVSSTVYLPRAAAAVVPARVGSDDSLPNLVKRSAAGQPFYPASAAYAGAGVARAAALPTTTPSLNSRSLTLARWNKALLLPKKSPGQASDLTPVSAFVAPDWIGVARDGSNPGSASTNVVGRYAYAIYDEGGLLDANAAGYPSALPAAYAGRKLGAPTADLTVLGLSASDVDALVGWRRYASAQPGGSFPGYSFNVGSATNYYNAAASDRSGFLLVGNALWNSQSDRLFGSRQQLIQFLLQGVAVGSGRRAALQNSLQYLGTFSRDLNQPAFAPDPKRPKIVGPWKAGQDNVPYPLTSGGNNAYGLDDQVNPSFLAVRAAGAFTRNDGGPAVPGEPLVKRRFLLNRLCWITYKGPSGALSAGDPVVTGLVGQGVPLALVQAGTAANILKYFGLTWDGTAKAWTYGHGAVQGAIHTLAEVQGLGRDPDFFELLKAGVAAGSLGKGAAAAHGSVSAGSTTAPGLGDAIQYNLDTNVDAQVLQIGANMVDQYDADAYPTHLQMTNPNPTTNAAGTVLSKLDFYGVESLPYLYRSRTVGVPVSTTAVEAMSNGYKGIGVGLMLLLPEVWNPHDPSGAPGTPGPTRFRFLLLPNRPAPYATRAMGQCDVYNTNNVYTVIGSAYGNSAFHDSDALGNASGLSELDFTVGSGSSACSEPVFLGGVTSTTGASQAASIGLSVPATHSLRTQAVAKVYVDASGYVGDVVSGLKYTGVLLGDYPLRWTNSIALPAVYPTNAPPLVPPDVTPANPNSAYNYSTANMCVTSAAYEANYVLQYDDGGVWRTYQSNYSMLPRYGRASTVSQHYGTRILDVSAASPSDTTRWNNTPWQSWIDPRTSRFGAAGEFYYLTVQPLAASQYSFFGKSNRPAADYGMGLGDATPGSALAGGNGNAPSIGWYPGNWNGGTVTDGSRLFIPGYYAENIPDTRPAPQAQGHYYADADGVVRRAMGAYVGTAPGTYEGMPQAALASSAAQHQSRPVVLNRPFRSVAELGYVFTGTPWKNLDFSTPESGAAPLLDLFCVSDTDDLDGLVAGKVSLNTRQPLVLQALLSGSGGQGYAYKDEQNPGTAAGSLTAAEAGAIAAALVKRTTGTAAGQGPLGNLSELVGKWSAASTIASGTAPLNVDGRLSYTGFSADVAGLFTDASAAKIERFQEASVRAFAAAGQTRVWNLMIDLVAQTGRYPDKETALDRFLVTGERRYWLHVAIDRSTGKILDQELEVVKE